MDGVCCVCHGYICLGFVDELWRVTADSSWQFVAGVSYGFNKLYRLVVWDAAGRERDGRKRISDGFNGGQILVALRFRIGF